MRLEKLVRDLESRVDAVVRKTRAELPEDLRRLYSDYRVIAYNHLFDEDEHPEGFYD